jgi:N-acetylglucosaminyl-diphospho-decaprenol L-rhamnosyltransferase
MHKISVIISNFNGAKYLTRLLSTLESQVGVTTDIIVIDRMSSDESDAILAKHPTVRVFKHPPETGLVSGYAFGVQFSKHDLLFFCNEDMWFEPRTLQFLAEAINVTERIGAVMPVQWTYDGTDIVNCGAWFSPVGWCSSSANPFYEAKWHLVERLTIVSGINAGACLIHRDAYDSIDGWDTSFFLDYEDLDLSIRLWQLGWRCSLVTESFVAHAVGASNSKLLKNGNVKVSKKRYINGSANACILGLKTFTGTALLLPLIQTSMRLVKNFAFLRWRLAYWDVLVLAEIYERLPAVIGYRRLKADINCHRPGQDYFAFPDFDYSQISSNRDPRNFSKK